jgi:hypothetical protein
MPFIAIFIGLCLVITGAQNTQGQFFQLLETDSVGFGKWALAIFGIGALGYIKPIRPVTDAFLVLVVMGLFFSNKGFFANLFNSVDNSTSATGSLSSSATSLLGGLSSNTGSIALGALSTN